jgi:hypothetical protein
MPPENKLREFESPFLDEELFVDGAEQQWEPRLNALQYENPFRQAFEHGLPDDAQPTVAGLEANGIELDEGELDVFEDEGWDEEALLDEEDLDEFSDDEDDTSYIEDEQDAFSDDVDSFQEEPLVAEEAWSQDGQQEHSLDEAEYLEEESTLDDEFFIEGDEGIVGGREEFEKVTAVSDLRDRIVQIAKQEWETWGRGTLDESDARARNHLLKYWMSFRPNGLAKAQAEERIRKRNAWSAVFISYVMREAGAGDAFVYDTYHSTYVAAAKQAAVAQDLAKFQAYGISTVKPELGDVVCRDRAKKIGGPCDGTNFANVAKGKLSHGDIVVQVATDHILILGGNTAQTYPAKGEGANTVGQRRIRLNEQGFVIPDQRKDGCKYFAIVKPAGVSHPASEDSGGSVLSSLPRQLSEAVRKGLFSLQVASTILSGERDENKLTNLIFLSRHPGRDPGEKIKRHERQLAREWLDIRDRIVGPILKVLAGTPEGARPFSKTSGTVLATVERYRPLAASAAAKYGLDLALVLGVIAAESGGNKDLVAKSGYTGLMQAGKGEAHKQPANSIDAGAKKLRDFRIIMEAVLKRRGQRYDRLPEADQLRLLALAYNAGPVTVAKALQYAAEAGTPERWLEDKHYKRALLFTGAYSIKQASTACLKGVSPSEQPSRMREAMRIWNQWRLGTKKTNWRKLEDPPPWPEVSKTLPPLVVCAIDFKHRNSPKYAAKILAYRERFQSSARNPAGKLRHEFDEDFAEHYSAKIEQPLVLHHVGGNREDDGDLGEFFNDSTSGEHIGSATDFRPAFEAGRKVSKTSQIRANLQTQLGIIASMIAEGPDEALKRENEFTDVIYWQLHPERVRQRIKKSDPAYARLRRDWLDARDLFIRPLFGAVRAERDAFLTLPTSHLEPDSIPSKSDVVRICRFYGDEVVARCKAKHDTDHCYIQRIRGEVACVDRILKRKRLTLEKLK